MARTRAAGTGRARTKVAERPLPLVTTDMPLPFRTAYIHSRRVRQLRKLLPVLMLGGLLTVVIVSVIAPLRRIELPFGVGTLSVNGTLLTMSTPRMSGYTRENRVYRVEADKADQDLTRSNIVNMQGVRGQIEMGQGNWANVTAAEGVADTTTGLVGLKRDIVLITTTGYEVRTNEAQIDTKSGSVVSDRPVDILSPGGKATALRMEWDNQRQVIILQGQVKGTMLPSAPDPDIKDREATASSGNTPQGGTQIKDRP